MDAVDRNLKLVAWESKIADEPSMTKWREKPEKLAGNMNVKCHTPSFEDKTGRANDEKLMNKKRN